jgi:hypothetical protein
VGQIAGLLIKSLLISGNILNILLRTMIANGGVSNQQMSNKSGTLLAVNEGARERLYCRLPLHAVPGSYQPASHPDFAGSHLHVPCTHAVMFCFLMMCWQQWTMRAPRTSPQLHCWALHPLQVRVRR